MGQKVDFGKAGLPEIEEGLVRAQLERMFASSAFAQAERLRQLLDFIVSRYLKGDLGALKERIIGIEVYGREPGYSTAEEPIVRTEARRLRAKIQQYYRDSGTNDRVIVELPSGGYVPRFEFRSPPAPVLFPVTPRPVSPPAKIWHREAAPGVGILLAAIAAFVLTHRSETSKATEVSPVTTYEGFEFNPALSPDGKWIAFVWEGTDRNYDIYVKRIGTETPVRLTTDPAHDLSPSWSPDGRLIAFLRSTPEKKSVYVIPATGGKERKILETSFGHSDWVQDASIIAHSPGPAWSLDGKQLAIGDLCGDRGPDCIYLVNLDGRERRRVTLADPGTPGDSMPAVSPSGRLLAFVRSAGPRGITDIYVQPLASGEPDGAARRVTFDQKTISGVCWLSDGRIAFTSNRGGPNALWSVPTQGGTPAPVPGASHGVTQVASSRDGRRIVYEEGFRQANVWRVDLSAPEGRRAPQKLIASSSVTNSAEYSPDGKSIVFVANRSGAWEIWTCVADGSNARQISHSGRKPIGTPRWSPNSRRIVYDFAPEVHSAVFVMDADGGNSRAITNDSWENMMPSWSRDGRFIYYVSRRRGGTAIWKKPVGDGAETLVAPDGSADAMEAPDGSLYFTKDSPGIWQLPVTGGTARLIPELAGASVRRYWTPSSRGLYFVDRAPRQGAIRFLDFSTREIAAVYAIEKAPLFGTPSLNLSPDGRYLIYSQLDQSGSDIRMIEMAR